MKRLCLVVSFVSLLISELTAQEENITADTIIERARATVGSPDALDGLVTLQFVASMEPVKLSIPAASIKIYARKPDSQRLEIRVDDMMETTILDGIYGCMVRSNLREKSSQMRNLESVELNRIRYATRQFFNFYKPDSRIGEEVSYTGETTFRGQQVHRLVYRCSDGHETVRYFSVDTHKLVAFRNDNEVASVHKGEIYAGGIKYPERIVYYEGSKKLHSIIFSEIMVNRPLPKGIFRIPNRVKGTSENLP